MKLALTVLFMMLALCLVTGENALAWEDPDEGSGLDGGGGSGTDDDDHPWGGDQIPTLPGEPSETKYITKFPTTGWVIVDLTIWSIQASLFEVTDSKTTDSGRVTR